MTERATDDEWTVFHVLLHHHPRTNKWPEDPRRLLAEDGIVSAAASCGPERAYVALERLVRRGVVWFDQQENRSMRLEWDYVKYDIDLPVAFTFICFQKNLRIPMPQATMAEMKHLDALRHIEHALSVPCGTRGSEFYKTMPS